MNKLVIAMVLCLPVAGCQVPPTKCEHLEKLDLLQEQNTLLKKVLAQKKAEIVQQNEANKPQLAPVDCLKIVQADGISASSGRAITAGLYRCLIRVQTHPDAQLTVYATPLGDEKRKYKLYLNSHPNHVYVMAVRVSSNLPKNLKIHVVAKTKKKTVHKTFELKGRDLIELVDE